MKHLINRRLTFTTGLLLFLLCLFFTFNSRTEQASAAYDGGRLVDNSVFLNAASMSPQDIQNFLVTRGSGLSSRSFQLNCYGPTSLERQWYTAAGAPCDQITPASHIIYYASQIYGVNPRVILATLQKEQSLITSPNPTDWQINQAMGYACPTTGQCAGNSTFFYQIDSGTWVLRFHYERARGNMNWWSPSTSWTCGTEKNYYKPNLYPNQNVNFYDEDGVMYRTHFISNAATSAFYCYTPHTYNNPQGLYGRTPYGTVGRYYSGSYNFVSFYELWFGPTTLPFAFKSSSSPIIYYMVDGYRVVVPAMGILQDYGISPQSIQTVSQATVDAIPIPPLSSGISNTLGYLVKSTSDSDADGGNLYLVSVGKKYPFASLNQFYDFGFKLSDITYVPLSHLYSIPTAQSLSSFVQAPNGALFQVGDAQKHNIFEYDTYRTLNPSDRVSAVSYFTVNLIPSGNPASNRQILIKTQNSESVSAYFNGKYYAIPSFDTYNCWGFSNTGVPVYRVTDNSYIAPITPAASLNCLTNNGSKTYLLGNTSQIEIPTQYGLPVTLQTPADILAMASKLPVRSTPLKQYIKSNLSSSVWFLEGGMRKPIPTYSNFLLLGVTSAQLDVIDNSSLSSLPVPSGIKLGSGQAVKTDTSPTVYLISGNARVAFASSDSFLASGNSWGDIETYSEASLNSAYPYGSQLINRYLYNQTQSKTYLLDPSGCVSMSESLLTEFGQSQSAIVADQPYNASIFPKLNLQSCRTGSTFVKQPGQSTVYWVNGGSKRLISKWDTLVSKSGSSNPYVVTLTASTLNTIPSGVPLD